MKKKVNVKIGSIGGSSFWYCHALTNSSLREIERHYKKHLVRSIRFKKDREYRLEHLDEIYEQEIVKTLQNKRRTIVNEEKFIANELLRKESERKRLPIDIKHFEFDIENSFLERQVVEIVDGICQDENPCKIIYVKGYERGEYWTLKEYAKANKENQ